MTQSELATRIGIIQSDLCRMEKGEYKVSLEVLFRILQVFGMSVGEFFDEPAEALGPSAGEAELLQGFRVLSPPARAEVLDYLRFKTQQERAEGEGQANLASGD